MREGSKTQTLLQAGIALSLYLNRLSSETIWFRDAAFKHKKRGDKLWRKVPRDLQG